MYINSHFQFMCASERSGRTERQRIEIKQQKYHFAAYVCMCTQDIAGGTANNHKLCVEIRNDNTATII